jgi:hypothetical protein
MTISSYKFSYNKCYLMKAAVYNTFNGAIEIK